MIQSSIRLDRNVPMEMRDGVLLRADICRPDDNEKHPAILTRTPYNKEERLVRGEGGFLTVIGSAYAGYARVIQDIRGRFASEGDWDTGKTSMAMEVDDGYDTVEWIASQPWCDGNVGMIGTSYDANLQWTTAMGNPPHLKAIAPETGTCGMRDQAIFGSPPHLSFQAFWTLLMGTNVADKLEEQGKDVSQMRQILDHGIANPYEVYNFLPMKDIPHFQFEGIKEVWKSMMLAFYPSTDQKEVFYWPYHEIKTACLHVGAWYDHNIAGMCKNFLGMRENGGSEFARQNQHILMGPWKHGAQGTDYLAELDFGTASGVPGLLVGRESVTTKPHMDFFNKYLRGVDVEIPAVRYFVMGKNEWRNADSWPLPDTQWQRFFLHSKGHANTVAGDGLLSRDEPRSESPDSFVYDPHSPVPTVGGRILAIGGMIPGPRDQYHIEKRDDVLCYTTTELNEDVEVTGPLELHLFAATSARDTDFTVKLIDVYPDGRAYNMAEGAIRARYGKSVFKPELVTPGEVNEYTINMGCTSCLSKKGHRIRVDVSSSNFPAWERNMNTGNPIGEDTRGIPATQTIYHQPDYASYIDLPVIPAR